MSDDPRPNDYEAPFCQACACPMVRMRWWRCPHCDTPHGWRPICNGCAQLRSYEGVGPASR